MYNGLNKIDIDVIIELLRCFFMKLDPSVHDDSYSSIDEIDKSLPQKNHDIIYDSLMKLKSMGMASLGAPYRNAKTKCCYGSNGGIGGYEYSRAKINYKGIEDSLNKLKELIECDEILKTQIDVNCIKNEGLQLGITNEKHRVANEMVRLKFEDHVIQEVTKLSFTEVSAIKEKSPFNRDPIPNPYYKYVEPEKEGE